MSPLPPARSHQTPLARVMAVAACLWLGACGGGSNAAPPPDTPQDSQVAASAPVAAATPSVWSWDLPEGFAPPVVPADNPMNAAKVELGRHLFYDVRLSGNGTLSCAGCHAPDRGFSDNRSLARGSTGEVHPRNSPGLINVAFSPTFNWAHPHVRTLEEQARTPMFGTAPIEMGVNDANRASVLQRLNNDAAYPPRFTAAFPDEAAPLDWDKVIKAIAAFERTLISANSRYDQWRVDQATLTPAEARGQRLFFGDKALCASCHGGPNFNQPVFSSAGGTTEPLFYNIGLFNIGGSGAYPAPNRGVFEFSGRAEDMGRFRAPSLRNVALTAPYLHDGSTATLEAVVAIHAAGGRDVGNGPYAGDGRLNPFKDPLINQIRIDAQEQTDLVAFLETLTDESVATNPRFANPFAK